MHNTIHLGDAMTTSGLRSRYTLQRIDGEAWSVWVTIDPDRLSGSTPSRVPEADWEHIMVEGTPLSDLVNTKKPKFR